MAIALNSKIVTDGLLLSVDPANIKSFKGIGLTNLNVAVDTGFNYPNSNTATFKVQNRVTTEIIPGGVGERVVRSTTYYNDYNGGSGQCCPAFIEYGNPGTWMNVSPSTTYVYAAIIKSESGYYSSNFLYRYEYNSSGNYITEQGLFHASRKIPLGDEWYMIWGTFTTNASTARLYARCFAYNYATWNTISVAGVAIYQGDDLVAPRHFPYPGETRTSLASDILQTSSSGTLQNGASYVDENNGSFAFDGVDEILTLSNPYSALLDYTFMFYVKWNSSLGGGRCFGLPSYGTYTIFNPSNIGYHYNPLGGVPSSTTLSSGVTAQYGTWYHVCVSETRDGGGKAKLYINGELQTSTTVVSSGGFVGTINLGAQRIASGTLAHCNISQFNLYNRVLSADEIKQNFNATRGRFGI